MIPEFYKDAEIFITGGSGVVGKAAIEKLLRSCETKRIYLLLRSRRGVSAEDRLEDLKKSRIFKVLKECKPDALNKLTAISGDLSLPQLGITPEHRKLLENVSVFIHSAATTRFNEPLRNAIRLNVKATLEALHLAETLKNLKIFVHVSTFFSNPHIKYIEDKIYPPVFDYKVALKLLDYDDNLEESVLDAIENKVITDFPNTYTFAKHLGEQLVNDYRSRVPVAIFKPAIVVAALEEPEVGFTETKTGVMGMILIWGSGLLKVLFCNENVVLAFIPLDICTKYLLLFAARTVLCPKEKFKESTPIASLSSLGVTTQTFGTITKEMTICSKEAPLEISLFLPGTKLTSSSFILFVYTFFLQLLPAMLIDAILKLVGRKPVFMAIQRKILITMMALKFFLITQFQSPGPTDFHELLEFTRGTEFDLNIGVNSTDTDEHFRTTMYEMIVGVRKYILNQDDSTIPRCRMILKAKTFVFNAIRIMILYYIGRAVYRRIFV